MKDKEIRFLDQDISEYRKWLKLNIYSVTWKGKYTKEFEEFWPLFFGKEQNLTQIVQRFEFAKSIVKIGPLISWLNFLMERLLAYTFIYKKTSLLEHLIVEEKSRSQLYSFSCPRVCAYS